MSIFFDARRSSWVSWAEAVAPFFGFRIRASEKSTSSGVTVFPLWNSSPCFSLSVHWVAVLLGVISSISQLCSLNFPSSQVSVS